MTSMRYARMDAQRSLRLAVLSKRVTAWLAGRARYPM